MATGLVFATLAWKKGMDWPLYLAYSIILSSMIRECLWSSGSWSVDQKYFIPWPLISITAITGMLFIVGNLLETRYTLFKHIPAASAVAFRFWMVLEWVIVISGSSTSLTLFKMRLMLGVLAWMVATTALTMESQLERDLVLANTYATYDFLARATSLVDRLRTQNLFVRLRSIFVFKWPYMGFRGRRASQASSEIQLGEFGLARTR
ncbi:hypothetical protein BGZ61DRAFT_524553 [Ilyonectria robusta]|uniref:uncharacterized protein n=1 Tax=Ilyonectria robusta TaxID=1079257 RepID=UPI001E8D8066|nr:uncharacterized protein BGZ61DRAFT_524553 [Ilyonectria robusta]KAH8651730.1 hypothetical protein BGZ61DRAFT_524553 [Ilyonectria robusta]